jgi:hypothetical protein
MITILMAVVVLAAIYGGLTLRLPNRLAFVIGVTVTLGFWAAPFVLPSSYANALYLILGVVGSVFFGLIGAMAWWRDRGIVDAGRSLWLVGGALAVAPAIVLALYTRFAKGF